MIKETTYQVNSPVSIGLITDTHNHPAKEVLRSVRRHHPDIICIAGDFLYARLPRQGLKMEESGHAVHLLRACSRLAPTFVSIGNHEWMLNEKDIDIIESTGVTLLNDDYIHYRAGSKDLVIGGLSSSCYHSYKTFCKNIAGNISGDTKNRTDKPITTDMTDISEKSILANVTMTDISENSILADVTMTDISENSILANVTMTDISENSILADVTDMSKKSILLDMANTTDPASLYPYIRQRNDLIQNYKPDVSWLKGFAAQSGYKILLCHHPEYYPRYLKKLDIDLILSGHAHGGQIRIFGQGLFAPGQGIFPKLTSGVVDRRLVISRGLSNNTAIPRLFNQREMVYLL